MRILRQRWYSDDPDDHRGLGALAGAGIAAAGIGAYGLHEYNNAVKATDLAEQDLKKMGYDVERSGKLSLKSADKFTTTTVSKNINGKIYERPHTERTGRFMEDSKKVLDERAGNNMFRKFKNGGVGTKIGMIAAPIGIIGAGAAAGYYLGKKRDS